MKCRAICDFKNLRTGEYVALGHIFDTSEKHGEKLIAAGCVVREVELPEKKEEVSSEVFSKKKKLKSAWGNKNRE